MRQRNIKNLEEKIENNSSFLIKNPKELKGKWKEAFHNDNPIRLEIGCGKGQFILKHAINEPNVNFIAIEGQSNIVLRALEKAEENNLSNLLIFIDFVHDLGEYFEAGELDKIYLNFSDPWPKARHAKRRLTYHKMLEQYRKALVKGGNVEFKTDNDELFIFTLEEVKISGMEELEVTRDLHNSEFVSREFTTEYEDRFAGKGKNINYIKIGV